MPDETTLPTRTESYVFWSDYFREYPERVKGLNLRRISRKDWLDTNEGKCPSCQGTELRKFPEPVITSDYTSTSVLCVCQVLHQMGHDYGDLESPWNVAWLKDLKPTEKSEDEDLQTIKDITIRFIEYLGDWVFLTGGFGSGKTHVLQAVKSNLRGLALYVNAADLKDYIYLSLKRGDLDEVTNTLCNVPVLLVDDLGVEAGSEWLYSVLYRVFNYRYAKRHLLPVFVTSNLTQEDLAGDQDRGLQRIASRLSDTKLVIPLVTNQADYRSME